MILPKVTTTAPLLLVLNALLFLTSVVATAVNDASLRLQFNSWLNTHGKSYGHKLRDIDNGDEPTSSLNSDEYRYRFNVYKSNAELVLRHNRAYELGLTSYSMDMGGPFSDLTDDEFATKYLMQGQQNCSATATKTTTSNKKKDLKRKNDDLPDSVDWRTRGVITKVKQQGGCGSCWTFSTTGTLEAHHCIANGVDCTDWTGLAEQQLVDCAYAYNNHGCKGGLPSQAFEYIHYAGGIMTEDSYQYTGRGDDRCKYHKNDGGGGGGKIQPIGAKVIDVVNITAYDEDEIVEVLAAVGPVSVAYQVSPDFRFYKHGVYDSYNATTNTTMCRKDEAHVNHAVVVVGYGQTSGNPANKKIPFYIIRNSWGNTWGMEGYFWMIRGQNMCGISDCASYPIVERRRQQKQQQKQQPPKQQEEYYYLRTPTTNTDPVVSDK